LGHAKIAERRSKTAKTEFSPLAHLLTEMIRLDRDGGLMIRREVFDEMRVIE
jgi:hypothetical protein